MAVSKLADGQILCKWEFNKRTEKITKITPHQMAARWTGKRCAEYFRDNGIENSANYCIGYDGDIYCNVLEENRAWTSSSGWNDQRAITVEISNSASGTSQMTDKSLEAFKQLATDIALRYGIDKYEYTGDKNGSFTLHRFYSNTNCPGSYFESKIPELIKDINARIKAKSTTISKTEEKKDTAKKETKTETKTETKLLAHVLIPNLNIRKGAGMNYPTIGRFTGVGTFTIVERNGDWGKLKSGLGWIYIANSAWVKLEGSLNETTKKKSVDEIAREVIQGKWYNGAARKAALTKAGYDYATIQRRVDEMLK